MTSAERTGDKLHPAEPLAGPALMVLLWTGPLLHILLEIHRHVPQVTHGGNPCLVVGIRAVCPELADSILER